MFVIYFVLFFMNCFFLEAQNSKYNLSVCSIFKEESKYIKEWIEYHKLIGVEHFYLYTTKNSDEVFDQLEPYIYSGLIELIIWPEVSSYFNEKNYDWPLISQVTAYENAKLQATDETKWLAFLDINEFILPVNQETIGEILEKYDDYSEITLFTDSYNSSQTHCYSPKKLIIESIFMTAAMQKNPYKEVKKTIFKPDQCKAFLWPPFRYKFKKRAKKISLSKKEMHINSYENRDGNHFNFKRNQVQLDSQILSQKQLQQVLDSGYEIEDKEKAIFRFLPKVRRNMQ